MEFLRRRREFIMLLGGAAAAWPLAAGAQDGPDTIDQSRLAAGYVDRMRRLFAAS